MTSVCYTPFKATTVRLTTLNACGQVVTGSCATAVSNGIISVAMTKEYEDRQEFFVKNGNGDFCVKETNPPILKWINLELHFCAVEPELLNIATKEPLVSDDAASPRFTGFSTEEGAAANVNFGLETWTRISGQNLGCTGTNGIEYGYALFPWVVEGTIGDITFQNDVVDFSITARTHANSLWGTGPYNVDLSDATGTLNQPIRLLTPIGSLQHHRMFTTRLAPPTAQCGCVPMFTP
jgi:hypothetical protein